LLSIAASALDMLMTHSDEVSIISQYFAVT
jgi:hypothetical protein